MPDPITLGSLFVGLAGALAGSVSDPFTTVIGGILGNEAHRGYLAILDGLGKIDRETGLPLNHHVQTASRDALRAAAHLLVLELSTQVEPRLPLVGKLKKLIRDGQLGRTPLLEADADPQREWVDALRRAIDEPEFDRWHDRDLHFGQVELQECFRGSDLCECFRALLTERFLQWARREVQVGVEPPGFAAVVEKGWSVRGGQLSLGQGYCLFFREFLKTRPEVARIYTVDLLSSVSGKVDDLATVIDTRLAECLGPLQELATTLRTDLASFREGLASFHEQQSSIHAALLTLAAQQEAHAAERQEFLALISTAVKALKAATFTLAPKLPLKRPAVPPLPRARAGNQDFDLALLNAKQRATALVGRDEDFESLWAWCTSAEPISARLLIGRAGAGKTRMAFELIWRVARELGEEWQAGIVERSDLQRFHDEAGWTIWVWQKPTLIVIDYAQACVSPLTDLLRALCEKKEADLPRLRLLLLDREASAASGWFSDLLRVESSTAGCPAADLFAPPTPLPLTPMGDAKTRRLLLAEALRSATVVRGLPPFTIPEEGADPQLDEKLGAPTWADPLYLLMAALVVVENDDAGTPEAVRLRSALSLNRMALAEHVAEHEARRLAHFVGAAPHTEHGPLFLHLAAVATLRSGLRHEELIPTVEEELAALHRVWPEGAGDLAHRLEQGMRVEQFPVAPIQPDIVAEAFILERLGFRDEKASSAAVARAIAHDPRYVATRLWHTVQNFFASRPYLDRLYRWIAAAIAVGKIHDLSLLVAIEGTLPHQTTYLLRPAVEITKAIYDALQSEHSATASPDPASVRELARIANNLANRQSDAGQVREALETAKEAVELYGQLAAENSEAYRPDLAMSLNNLATMQSRAGQVREALETAKKAVELRRQLAAENPEAYRPDLAMSLNNLANMQSGAGQVREALETAKKAVELRRQLAAENPEAYRPKLAASLNNLVAMQSDAGQVREALETAKEAVELYGQLAAENPEAYRPNLAMSLNNLANGQSGAGQVREALETANKAVELRRQLAAENPEAYRPDLAMSLNNLAAMQSDAGQVREALETAKEAVELYEQLAAENAEAYRPDLAMSLNNLAARQSRAGQVREALETAKKAVELQRQLAAENPEAYRPDLARSLNNLANTQSGAGQVREALETAKEAVELRRELAAENPEAYRPNLAKSLGMFGAILRADGHTAEAAARFAEGAQILTSAFQAYPPANARLMGGLIKQHVESCEAAGLEPDLEAIGPALAIFEQLRQQQAGPAPDSAT